MKVDAGGTSVEKARRAIMWPAIAAVLLLPLIVMQVTDEVTWTAFDFAAAGVLLGAAGLSYEVVAARTRAPLRRKIIGAAIIAIVVVIWAHGAVGIF